MEPPHYTAQRELQEETGCVVDISKLRVIRKKEKKDHMVYFFLAYLPALPSYHTSGNGGEEVAIFQPREILARDDFFPSHLSVIRGILEKL